MGRFVWLIFLIILACLACSSTEESQNLDTATSSDDDSDFPDSGTGKDTDPPEDTRAPLAMDWVTIAPGSFVYGSSEGTTCRAAYTEEQATVTLTNSFVMAKTEVTQHQWEQTGLSLPIQDDVGPNIPAMYVSFYEAAVFCNELSKKEGLDTCYDMSSCSGDFAATCPKGDPDYRNCGCGTLDATCEHSPNTYHCDEAPHKYPDRYSCPGYRMPTNAEWEYAAKAGTTTQTYNGDLLTWENLACQEHPALNDIAWYCHNSGNKPQAVALKKPNPWGLYDMIGNVEEWVDHRHTGASILEEIAVTGEDLTNPIGLSFNGSRCTLRGGSYKGESCFVKTPGMTWDSPSYKRNLTSFRPVRTLFK